MTRLEVFRRFSRLLAVGILAAQVVLGAGPLARPVSAESTVVGDGTPASCTSFALQLAIDLVQDTDDAEIFFNCGPAPHTIAITATLVITGGVTINGGSLGAITLSGEDARRVLKVQGAFGATLENLVIQEGYIYDGYGGCLLAEGAFLLIINTIVHSCHVGLPISLTAGAAEVADLAPIGEGIVSIGGAIALLDSAALIGESEVLSSTADVGGGIYSSYGVGLFDSRVAGNRAVNGGGLFVTGDFYATGALIEHNQALVAGGLALVSTTSAKIDSTRIFSNTSNTQAGGLYSSTGVTVTLTNSLIEQNVAAVLGGGAFIYTGTLSISSTLIAGNRASAGGGVYVYKGALNLARSWVDHNHASGDGGGVANDQGRATLEAVTLSGNQAGADGGGYFDTNPYDGWSELTNVTVSGNTAGSAAGGIKSIKPLTLTNVTIAYNTGDGGFYRTNNYKPYVFQNVLLTQNLSDGAELNCMGPAGTFANSLSSDLTCDFLAGSAANLPLSPLQANGGLTGLLLPTHLPLTGNTAIDAGDNCPAVDQRGAARPAGAACDVGAVETAAMVPWVWLPLISR